MKVKLLHSKRRKLMRAISLAAEKHDRQHEQDRDWDREISEQFYQIWRVFKHLLSIFSQVLHMYCFRPDARKATTHTTSQRFLWSRFPMSLIGHEVLYNQTFFFVCWFVLPILFLPFQIMPSMWHSHTTSVCVKHRVSRVEWMAVKRKKNQPQPQPTTHNSNNNNYNNNDQEGEVAYDDENCSFMTKKSLLQTVSLDF